MDNNTNVALLSTRLLVFFFALSILVYLLPVRYLNRPTWWFIATAVSLVLLIFAWVLWHKQRSKRTAVLFTIVCFLSFLLADAPTSLGLQWMALVVLALEFSPKKASLYALLQLLVVVGAHISIGSSIFRIFGEGLFVVLTSAIGLTFASLLRGLDENDRQRRQALLELQEKLRMSRELALTQERERIAASLHDNLGHRLTTIGMSLDYSLRVLQNQPEKARAEIEQARQSASDALGVMRATVRAMRPVKLKNDSVKDTLETLAESFHSTGFTVTCELLDDVHDEELALLIIRTVQEALTNTVRHSEADHAHITLTASELTVSDNGDGSDNPLDFGLSGLKETAQELGACLTTEPHGGIDGGFYVNLSFPEPK